MSTFHPDIKPLLVDLKKLVDSAKESLAEIETIQEQSNQIDTLRLHEQCAEQPELVNRIGKLVSNIYYIGKEAALLNTTIEGRLRGIIRQNPEKFNLDKITEKAIDETYISSAEYFKAQKFLNEIDRIDKESKNAMLSLEHRRSTFRVEERLYNGEYFLVDQPIFLSRKIKDKQIEDKRRRSTKAKLDKKEQLKEDSEDDSEEKYSE